MADSATIPSHEDGRQEAVVKEYQCKFCDVKMATHYQINSHMRVHKGLTKSLKTDSSTVSKKVKNFTKIILKNGEKLYKCNICKKKVTTHFQLNSHLRVHKLSKKTITPAPLPLPIFDSNPPGTTEVKNRFDCKLCDKKMTNRFQHNSHMQIHKNKVFKKPTAIPLPVRIRTKHLKFGGKKRYHCKFCDVKMATHYQLNSHMRVHKVKTDILDSSAPSPVPAQLPPPENLSSRNQNRKDYHSLHHGAPLRISGMRTSSTDTRRSSSASVDKEVQQADETLKVSPVKVERLKTFKCHICGGMMRNQNHLNSHMRIHKKRKAGQEGHEKVQVTPGNWESLFSPLTQKRVHDGPLYFSPVRFIRIKPFKCKKCHYSANASVSLALHVRLVHEGLTPHPCGVCWKSFPTRVRLEEHLSRNHDQLSNGFEEQNEIITENGALSV